MRWKHKVLDWGNMTISGLCQLQAGVVPFTAIPSAVYILSPKPLPLLEGSLELCLLPSTVPQLESSQYPCSLVTTTQISFLLMLRPDKHNFCPLSLISQVSAHRKCFYLQSSITRCTVRTLLKQFRFKPQA